VKSEYEIRNRNTTRDQRYDGTNVTQNSALYFAQHKNWAPRPNFSGYFVLALASSALPESSNHGELFFWADFTARAER